ncbi:MAG TPA: hypothetical protein VIC85_10965 [Ktedonobacterales bacterium]|jgi:hypothetical protein
MTANAADGPDASKDEIYRVGVTGHRTVAHPDAVARACRSVLQEIMRLHPRAVVCSSLAPGADCICAEQALALGMPIEAVIPYASYLDDFTTPADRALYERLRSAAHVITMPYEEFNDGNYLAAGLWMLDNSQLLLAIWNGRDVPRRPGGTADMVARARQRGLPVRVVAAERGADPGMTVGHGAGEGGHDVDSHVFEQYKLIVEDSARLSDRRQTINNLYLSANSLLLGGVAVLVQLSQLKNPLELLLIVLIAVAGSALCLDWRRVVPQYKRLLDLRFSILREMEESPDFPAPKKLYVTESARLYNQKGLFANFSDVESNIPVVFLVIYVIAVAAMFALKYADIVAQFSTWGIPLPH